MSHSVNFTMRMKCEKIVINIVILFSIQKVCSSYPLGSCNSCIESVNNDDDRYEDIIKNEERFFQFSGGYIETIFNYLRSGFNVLIGRGKSSNMLRSSNKKSYKKYKLFRVWPRTKSQVEDLEAMSEELDGIQFWTMPLRNHSTDVLVPPNMIKDIQGFLDERKLDYDIAIEDLQKVISGQNPKLTKEQRVELRGSRGHDMTFRRYHRYGDMLRYIEHLATGHSNIVNVINIGKSTEGLPIKVVKVSSGGSYTKDGQEKPAIWIDGGMHAREWISPAVVMYILKQLIENFKVNKQIVENADWYLLPVANPDGYEYTHTTDRLWRKSRSDSDSFEGRNLVSFFFDNCEGVDLNRNWDYHWGEKGASDDPCHETYAGPAPFSEPETRAISQFILEHKDRIKLFLTLHSYSQMWLMPWGYTNKKVADFNDLYSMGRKAIDAIAKITGTEYEVGPSISMLYPASGSADDWAKGVAGIKYAYTVELRDKGTYGFMLPASQIIPTGKETFSAIKAIAKSIICKT